MKKLVMVTLLLVIAFHSFGDSVTGTVKQINMFGSNWSSNWSGDILFLITSMPTGISYFYFRQEDDGFKQFLSALFFSKAMQIEVAIYYDPADTDVNSGYCPIQAIFITP